LDSSFSFTGLKQPFSASNIYYRFLDLFGLMGRAGILTNSTMVCAPLMARSVEQMVIDMQSAEAQGADAVEVRLDYINSFQPSQDLETIIRNKPLPVIIVYRFYSIWSLNTISFSLFFVVLNYH